MSDAQNFLEVYAKEVKEGRCRYLVVDRLKDVKFQSLNVLNG